VGPSPPPLGMGNSSDSLRCMGASVSPTVSWNTCPTGQNGRGLLQSGTVKTVPYRILRRMRRLHAGCCRGKSWPGCFATGPFYLQRRAPFWYININSMASTSCWTPAPARSTPWTRWLMTPFLYMKLTLPRKSWINSWNNTPASPM